MAATHRERFFDVVAGRKPDRPAFFPDVSDWYIWRRTAEGETRRYEPGQFIPDGDSFHRTAGRMEGAWADFTYLDFYRRHDWGLPAHIYDWYDIRYEGVQKEVRQEGDRRRTRLACPLGEVERVETRAEDGSWAPTQYFCRNVGELAIMDYVNEHSRYEPRYEDVSEVLRGIGEQGVADVVIPRSPFGKLVHYYLGFENVAYALHDDRGAIEAFLTRQEERDLELIRRAAAGPGRVVIISDHTDERLIAPNQYREYCVPYYQKACRILHAGGKLVSTHLDGNIRGYFPYLAETGFDILDGCTPAPMMNYEVEELAGAIPESMNCWCGVPAIYFCGTADRKQVEEYGRRILRAFDGRVILNVGDILPPDGDMETVIRWGQSLREF